MTASGTNAADATVLVVEDDRDMAVALRRNFEREGYAVVVSPDGECALEAVRARCPDLIVLDVMLPKVDGFQVLRILRAEGVEVPVLLLTARSTEADKIFGFRIGADDYLTKPFSLQELLARVAALLRRSRTPLRSTEPTPEQIAFGEIVIDVSTRTVRRADQVVALTPKAYELLLVLARRPGVTISRRELMRDVWGYSDGVASRTLDAHVAELRRKLEGDPGAPKHIVTVWRVGYRLERDSGV